MPAHVAILIALLLWTTDAAFAAPLRYRLEVVAPDALKATVSRSLDLVRWENYEEMTPELLDRLVLEAREQARQIAATEGYFEPKIDIDVDRNLEPALVRITIDPGVPTRISRVDLTLQGSVAEDPTRLEQRLAPLREQWSLRIGEVFRQVEWNRFFQVHPHDRFFTAFDEIAKPLLAAGQSLFIVLAFQLG